VFVLEAAKVVVVKKADAVMAIARIANTENILVFVHLGNCTLIIIYYAHYEK
jgi:hypothetical protein